MVILSSRDVITKGTAIVLARLVPSSQSQVWMASHVSKLQLIRDFSTANP